jgi:hypothetical protein
MFLFQDTYPIFTLMHPSYVPFPRYLPDIYSHASIFFFFRNWCVLKVRGEFKSKPNCFNSSTLLKLGSLFFNILDIDVADVDIHFWQRSYHCWKAVGNRPPWPRFLRPQWWCQSGRWAWRTPPTLLGSDSSYDPFPSHFQAVLFQADACQHVFHALNKGRNLLVPWGRSAILDNVRSVNQSIVPGHNLQLLILSCFKLPRTSLM